MNVNTTEDAIAEQAAQWIMLLRECPPEQLDKQRRRFSDWRRADLRHATAAQRVEKFLGQVSTIKDDKRKQARNVLESSLNTQAKRSRQQLANKMLAILLILGLPILFTLQFYPSYYLTADQIAVAGEWQNHTLADGSKITLAGKTAIDIDFDEKKRLLTLHNGEIHITVAPDKNRPFIVRTDFGDIEALGTQFIVNHRNAIKSRVTMIESRVKITTKATNQQFDEQTLAAGEQLTFNSQGLGSIRPFDIGLYKKRWLNHRLLVQDWSLDEVLQELRRYHKGYIYFDADELASIQVSAVLPLDKPTKALDLLASNFDSIRIRKLSPWLIVVEHIK